MRFVRLSCPRGRRFTSVFGPNGRGGSRPAAVGHPAQAVAESSSRGHSPFARWQPPIRTVLNAKFPTPCDAGQILLYQVLPKIYFFSPLLRLFGGTMEAPACYRMLCSCAITNFCKIYIYNGFYFV